MTLDDARMAWLGWLNNQKRCSPHTLTAYGHAFRGYIAHLRQQWGEPSLDDVAQVTSADLRGWMAHLRAKDPPLTARSLAQHLSAVKSFHSYLDLHLGRSNAQVGLMRGPRLKATLPRPLNEDQAMGLLIDGIKRDQPAEGFEKAIALCGQILATHFPARADDNPDELPNTVVELP